jgi:RNA polymerase sigma-70 factor (ECF subfamily)
MMTVLAEPAPRLRNCTQEVAPALAVDFDDFYRSEYSGALQFAYVLTGRMAVAEELVQDAFLAAYGRWDQVASYTDPGAWIRGALANAAIRGAQGATGCVPGRLHEACAGRRAPQRTRNSRRSASPGASTQVIASRCSRTARRGDGRDPHVGEETVRTHLRRGRRALAAMLRVQDDEQ